MNTKKYCEQVVDYILANNNVVRATKYLAPNMIIRGVRKTYKIYKRKPRTNHNVEISLTIGKPNYVEREFIALCKKAKEPFPVKKIQLRVYDIKKKHTILG